MTETTTATTMTTATATTPMIPSQPPIFLLPNEILDSIFSRLFDPTPDVEAFERALGWQTYNKGDPPKQNTPETLAALANSCRRFYLLASPRLYDTLLVYLPRQPKRVHRLYRTLSEHSELVAHCNRAYIVREMDDGDDWVALTAGFPQTPQASLPSREVREAREKLRSLTELMVCRGIVVRERQGQWEQPHPQRRKPIMSSSGASCTDGGLGVGGG